MEEFSISQMMPGEKTRLPYEDATIPLSELPEAEQDNGGSTESVKEQEMKWSDLALQFA
uniref:Anaphase-promoting complex subunit 13 n=1 Tax=Sinocyclocheilus grahami TaxID=75366 RepID=A0A672SNG5_SINGR